MRKTPERLKALEDLGVIQRVIRPLMSGKEAAVYLVEAQDELRVAKVYKDASNRSFQNRADYTEGRRVRNSRQQRAMAKRSRYGRTEIEAAWRTAEVDAIYKLRTAGVAVPEPFDFVEGVLVMELVKGWDGGPAPRLVDMDLSRDEARALLDILIKEVVGMLCAGVVHGDLSDFNVLITPEKPVIIDFPQWVDPAHNRNARKLLIRDVDNLVGFLSRFDPSLQRLKYAPEMWDLYEKGKLKPHTKLTGTHRASTRKANVRRVVEEIQAAEVEHRRRTGEADDHGSGPDDADSRSRRRPRNRGRKKSVAETFFEGLEWRGSSDAAKGPSTRAPAEPPPLPKSAAPGGSGAGGEGKSGAAKKRRRRRRRRKPGGGAPGDPRREG